MDGFYEKELKSIFGLYVSYVRNFLQDLFCDKLQMLKIKYEKRSKSYKANTKRPISLK